MVGFQPQFCSYYSYSLSFVLVCFVGGVVLVLLVVWFTFVDGVVLVLLVVGF